MNKIIYEDIRELDLLKEAKRKLYIIEFMLITCRIFLNLFYYISSPTKLVNFKLEILICFIEIAAIHIFFRIIKYGYKKIAFLLLLFCFLSLIFFVKNINKSYSIINIFLIYSTLINSILQFLSMTYILLSKKVDFYCNYTLFNRNIKY